jgi:hypothetical protein
MSKHHSIMAACVLSTVVAGACSSEPGESPVAEVSSSLINVDEFLYFRCNSTAWGVDNTTRLKATSNPSVVSLTFQVTQQQFLTDQCFLTWTNQLNGWGTSQGAYAPEFGYMFVPMGQSIVSTSSTTPFYVYFNSPGTYTLTVNWDRKYFYLSTPASCSDGVKNGGETDVDCGGACGPCAVGKACLEDPDCQGNACEHGRCVGPDDLDGDRLANSAETNTNVYVSPTNTGTDPENWDSDGDGLADGDEVLGTTGGLNLPGMGVTPLRKNILIEYDWFEDANDCGAHSHRPTPATASMVSAAFAASPVTNPDGTTGVTIIQDYGQGGLFTGGNEIADSDGVVAGGVGSPDFVGYRAANFVGNRQGYFHYTLLPHRYDTDSNSSGQAEIVGDDLIVSLYCANSDYNVAAATVHELGHNLGLLHGGNVYTNYKPNYNSVMNYAYTFPGVDTNCTPAGDGVIDYARNQRIPLNEQALDEREGICGTPPWDWNYNSVIEPSISQDINGDSFLEVLEDHDDWAALVYDWDPQYSALAATEIVTCDIRPPGY